MNVVPCLIPEKRISSEPAGTPNIKKQHSAPWAAPVNLDVPPIHSGVTTLAVSPKLSDNRLPAKNAQQI